MRNTFFFCLIYMGLLIPAKAQHYTTLNLEQQLPTEDGWWRLFSDPRQPDPESHPQQLQSAKYAAQYRYCQKTNPGTTERLVAGIKRHSIL